MHRCISVLVVVTTTIVSGASVGWQNHPGVAANSGQAGYKNHSKLNNGSVEIEDNNLDKWRDDDVIEVYLGDYVLQNVELSSMLSFTVYHMAVLFQNPVRHKWFTVDYFARTAETIANILMPSLPPFSPWFEMTWYEKLFAYFRGEIVDYVVWDNLGYVQMKESKSGQYTDLQHVGSIYGHQVKALREWIVSNYTRNHTGGGITFDMWSVYDATSQGRLHESRNCHDFIEHVLRELKFERGISPYEAELGTGQVTSVYRDSLSLTAREMRKIDVANNAKKRRDFQRFMRLLRMNVYEVTRDLALSRYAITRMSKIGIPFIFRANGIDYYEVEPGNINPLNYCRIPMDFVKGEEYVPALWNDTRRVCHFPYFEIEDLHKETPYGVMDYVLMIEQAIDDAIFGRDGNGVPLTDHLMIIVETTVLLVAIAKAISWLTTANKRI